MPDLPDSPGSAVAVGGGCNMDIVVSTRLPLQSADSTLGQIACCPGGVARNVAENPARPGNRTQLVSVPGDDVFAMDCAELTLSAPAANHPEIARAARHWRSARSAALAQRAQRGIGAARAARHWRSARRASSITTAAPGGQ